MRIARAALHFWEEPCITGKTGSGAVFFSGCQLKCVYCQNRSIAYGGVGKEITVERLCEIFFELKEKGAGNINLVTCDHFYPDVAKSIERVKKEGFGLPFVLNTSGYVSEEEIEKFDGLIDIYLSDFKYFSPFLAKKYSHAPDYPGVVKKATDKMFSLIKGAVINEKGMMERGLIVRHLVLPTHADDSKKIISYLYNRYSDDIYISIMNQFTPTVNCKAFPELMRKVSEEEYAGVIDFALSLGIKNAFVQEEGTCDESFIPAFDYEGV